MTIREQDGAQEWYKHWHSGTAILWAIIALCLWPRGLLRSADMHAMATNPQSLACKLGKIQTFHNSWHVCVCLRLSTITWMWRKTWKNDHEVNKLGRIRRRKGEGEAKQGITRIQDPSPTKMVMIVTWVTLKLELTQTPPRYREALEGCLPPEEVLPNPYLGMEIGSNKLFKFLNTCPNSNLIASNTHREPRSTRFHEAVRYHCEFFACFSCLLHYKAFISCVRMP